MDNNILKVVFGEDRTSMENYARSAPLWQYDYGQKLLIEGVTLPLAYEVHFSNKRHGDSVTAVGDETGVDIPDEMLLSGQDVYAWVYLHETENDGETEYMVTIPVNKRAKPTNQEPTPVQQDVIDQTIAALQAAVARSETNVTHYPCIIDGYWYVWDAEQNVFVNTEVSGHGEKGDDGNGIARIELNPNYTLTFYYTNGTSYTTGSIRGAQGPQGEPGPKGDKGDKGDPGKPMDIIDDTAGAGETERAWSADKLVTELGTKADKTDTVLETTLSRGRKANSTTGTGSSAFGNDVEASGAYSHAEGYGSQSKGESSHAEGNYTKATSNYAHSEGNNTTASGSSSHAEGYKATASNSYAHAEGDNTTASGQSSHAEGIRTEATGLGSHAEGYYSKSTGQHAHTEGARGDIASKMYNGVLYAVGASGARSHAEGLGGIAAGTEAHAEGNGTYAIGDDSHAEGIDTKATGLSAHAEGSYNIASGMCSHAEGYNTIANGHNSHVSGRYNVADGNNNYAEIIGNGTGNATRSNARTLDWNGNEHLLGDIYVHCNPDGTGGIKVDPSGGGGDVSNKADKTDTVLLTTLSRGRKENTTVGEASFAFGVNVEASGVSSHAEGSGTVASYQNTHAEGTATKATGDSAHAEGVATLASGMYSHAEGLGGSYTQSSQTIVSEAHGITDHVEGYMCRTYQGMPGNHAEGYQTHAIGGASHSEGGYSQASGVSSHAEGNSTTASGYASHAEGGSTQATGTHAHSEGSGTLSTGNQTHAEGSETQATGNQAHAEGAATIASGAQSHAEGGATHATGETSHAEGGGTWANGMSSHAEGSGTHAESRGAHSEGEQTIAVGQAHHAGGRYNVPDNHNDFPEWVSETAYAVGDKVKVTTVVDNVTTVKGYRCKTANSDLTFNPAKWDEYDYLRYAEIIGNGTADNARSNARSLDWEGNERLMGNIYVGCNPDGTGGTMLVNVEFATDAETELIIIGA